MWITLWMPPDWMLAVKADAETVLPVLEVAVSALPSPHVWLSLLAWTVWAIGSLILVACAMRKAQAMGAPCWSTALQHFHPSAGALHVHRVLYKTDL